MKTSFIAALFVCLPLLPAQARNLLENVFDCQDRWELVVHLTQKVDAIEARTTKLVILSSMRNIAAEWQVRETQNDLADIYIEAQATLERLKAPTICPPTDLMETTQDAIQRIKRAMLALSEHDLFWSH